MSSMAIAVPAGLLFPEALLHTHWFAILATFVAINTVMYAALALAEDPAQGATASDWIRHAAMSAPRRAVSTPRPGSDPGVRACPPPGRSEWTYCAICPLPSPDGGHAQSS